MWARGRCRISPPRFLAECCKRQLNQASFVLLYFRLFTFFDLYWVCLYFPVLFCLSVSVKWLAVKTASEMTSNVSGGALNSYSNQSWIFFSTESRDWLWRMYLKWPLLCLVGRKTLLWQWLLSALQGEPIGKTEATEAFFAMTKLFQSRDVSYHSVLCYRLLV